MPLALTLQRKNGMSDMARKSRKLRKSFIGQPYPRWRKNKVNSQESSLEYKQKNPSGPKSRMGDISSSQRTITIQPLPSADCRHLGKEKDDKEGSKGVSIDNGRQECA
jgi:hypothetical protein